MVLNEDKSPRLEAVLSWPAVLVWPDVVGEAPAEPLSAGFEHPATITSTAIADRATGFESKRM
ncbi:MAG: hypothetical protein NVSMB6_10170 [Burkholderiaceae bacterium]